MRVMHSFYVLGKQIYKQLSKVVLFHTTSSFGEHSNVSTYELPLRNPLSLFRRYFYFILLLRDSRDFVQWVGVQTVLTSENVFEDARIKTNKASTASRRAQVRKIAYPATLSLLLVSSLKCGGKGL